MYTLLFINNSYTEITVNTDTLMWAKTYKHRIMILFAVFGKFFADTFGAVVKYFYNER